MVKDHRVSIETVSAQFDVSVGTEVEVLREFRKRYRRKRPALFELDQWHFH